MIQHQSNIGMLSLLVIVQSYFEDVRRATASWLNQDGCLHPVSFQQSLISSKHG